MSIDLNNNDFIKGPAASYFQSVMAEALERLNSSKGELLAVLKAVPIQIQQTTQTNTTVNMRLRGRSGLLRLSSAIEFAKNLATEGELRLRVFPGSNDGRYSTAR